jgi:iron complex outermembrane receptor protein
MRQLSSTRSLLLAGIAIAIANPALAQDATSDKPPSETVTSEGDIVVTAQRREQSLQDVGLSLTAIGGEAVADLGIKDIVGIAALVPGLSINNQGGEGNQPVIFLRGVGLNDFSENNSSPIAVYFDDVYVSSQAAQTAGQFDLARIEVLKGPQGTLYGRNATGGAIRFIPRRSGEQFEVEGRASIAEFGTRRIELAASLPMADRVGIRLAGTHSRSDGFMRNTLTGEPTGGYEITSLRAIFSAETANEVAVEIGAFADVSRNDGVAYRFRGALDPVTLAPCVAARVAAGACANFLGYRGEPGRFEGAYDRAGGTNREILGGWFKVGKDFGDIELNSISSFITVDSIVRNDTDASPASILHLDFDVQSETFTQEIRLNWSGPRHNLVFGGFFLTEKIDQNQTADLFRVFRPIAAAINPVGFPGGFDPAGAATGAPIIFARGINRQDTDTFAIYGQADYEPFDALRVILGLRYSNEERRFRTRTILEEPAFSVPLYNISLGIDDDNVSFRTGLEWQPNTDVLIYGNVSTGYKSGGFNGGLILNPLQVQPYRSERLTAYEAGIKTEWLNRRLRANAAIFRYDYKDIQLFTLISSGGVPTSVLTNAGAAEINGVELELGARPADGFDLSVSAAYLNATLTEFETAAVLGGQDFTGNRLPKTPRWSLSLQSSYSLPLGDWGDLKLLGNAKYQSRVFFDTTNTDILAQPGHWLVDARAAIAGRDDRWEIALFARNLFNKDHNLVSINLAAFGFYSEVPGAPRTLGAEAVFRF